VAAALGQRRAVLLKNHGVAVASASIEETVVSVVMLETAAKVQMMTEAAGVPVPVPEMSFLREDIETLRHQISRPEQFAINFDYLARRVQHKA
jgi:L-fuculose-phosphate aldolase